MNISVSAFGCPNKDFEANRKLFSKEYADSIHIDFMDGICVPLQGITFNELIKIRDLSRLPLEAHFMVENQSSYVKKSLSTKLIDSFILTIEREKKEDLFNEISMIKEKGKAVGVAIWPSTDTQKLYPFIEKIDSLLIMTSEAGQPHSMFLESSYSRVAHIVKIIRSYSDVLCIVDGGIQPEMIPVLQKAGIEEAVVGRAFFDKSKRKEIEVIRSGFTH